MATDGTMTVEELAAKWNAPVEAVRLGNEYVQQHVPIFAGSETYGLGAYVAGYQKAQLIGATINGHEIIAAVRIPDADGLKRNRHVVVAENKHSGPRYAAATYVPGEPEWDRALYTDDLAKALAEMSRRAL